MKLLKSKWVYYEGDYRGAFTDVRCGALITFKGYICPDWLSDWYTFSKGTRQIRLVLSEQRIQDSDPIYLKGSGCTYGFWSWSWLPYDEIGDAFLYALGKDIADAGILEVDKWKKFYLRIECR